MKHFIPSLLLLASANVFAHGNEDIVPPKAVVEFSAKDGLRLAKTAIERLELKTTPVSTPGMARVPEGAIVHSLSDIGIYRLRDGLYKLVPIQTPLKTDSGMDIRSSEIKKGDQIVVHGVPLLRVTEMEAAGGEE